ncbi:hypothetical protein [Haladaptatus sp. AB643]|uniref:ORC-CDC6 family AAA ATPase n=1 Tax=Haladaptatus sp. AB643 TaxID=2934174 RepID=UPI00209C56FA|nr:hypothetical protein [Haladaptatus sp. AB643]MCO8242961.1 hypothetical protein [Haladaptatus sp. AB643]
MGKEVRIMIDLSENPFAVHSPDALKDVPAETIVRLFISEHTQLDNVREKKHTFVWGPRGSGKSFMLRYLEPQCRFVEYDSPGEFFESENSFIGIYTPCKKGEIDKTELDLLDDRASQVITEHLLNLTVAEETLSTLSEQFPADYFEHDDCVEFCDSVTGFFDRGSIAKSKEYASERYNQSEHPFKWLQEVFTSEKRQIDHYLRQLSLNSDAKYAGATSGYHDFLLPLMDSVQKLVGDPDVPIYVFLDDAFHLFEEQQEVVNTWIANRDQSTLCIKVSSTKEGYETFETSGRGMIELTHDYTELDFEELYTNSDRQYSKKVRGIVEKRLEVAEMVTTDVDEFLPRSEFEVGLIEEIKENLEEEWLEEGEPGRRSDYIARYANARLFQRLAEGKTGKTYSGFDEIVHISSGVVRNFLEPCQLMFNEVKQGGKKASEIEAIPASTQDDVLKQNSEDFLRQAPLKIAKSLPEEDMPYLDDLKTLVRSLGKLFYERLHDEESREPRMFSFTVRGKIPKDSDLSKVLELGERVQYFKVKTYSTKDGGGREDWYILNRRLAPMFKLDPTGFEGRMSLTPELLEIGCEDPAEFVRLRLDIDEHQEPLDRFFKDD